MHLIIGVAFALAEQRNRGIRHGMGYRAQPRNECFGQFGNPVHLLVKFPDIFSFKQCEIVIVRVCDVELSRANVRLEWDANIGVRHHEALVICCRVRAEREKRETPKIQSGFREMLSHGTCSFIIGQPTRTSTTLHNYVC